MTVALVSIVFNLSDEKTMQFGYFFKLPSYLFYEVLNLKTENANLIEKVILGISAYLFNVVMYAPVFYSIFTILPKRKPKIKVSEFPPEPPQFN